MSELKAKEYNKISLQVKQSSTGVYFGTEPKSSITALSKTRLIKPADVEN